MADEPTRSGALALTDVPQDVLLRLYRTMYTITMCDRRGRNEARSGRLKAPIYPVHGLEAVCAVLGEVLRPSDHLVTTYRNLGDVIAKGMSLRGVISEWYGRVDGVSRGKGGTMHLAQVDVGVMMTSGIVGGGLPVAAGLALAAKLSTSGRIAVATFGDGATSIGAFHETANLAALWKLPLILVCQNNQWGEHTPLRAYAANPDIAGRTAAYGMATAKVDGFNPLAVLEVLPSAVERARAGEGPAFIECVTYRLGPHSGVSDLSYVPKDELARALTRDPTPNFRANLVAAGIVSPQRLDEVEKEVDAEIADAFDYAVQSAFPDPSTIFDHVYSQPVRSLMKEAR